MSWQLYFQLSAMMFLEYAIWGAWAPVLAARLLGPLKMSGKQTGWIYATLPLACIISPLVAGQLADKWVNTELILAVAHLVGAMLLFVAAWKSTFRSLFVLMLLYSLCYAATLPLVNSLMFHQLGKAYADQAEADAASANIFIWAPIAWALVGYSLTGWRWMFKTGAQGRDCLCLAAILSVVMAVSCSFLPKTLPAQTGDIPIVKAVGMLGESSFLIFIVISMVAAGMMQFYFLGTAQFMQDMGIASKNVPASMAIAQAVQAAATFFLLGRLLDPEQVGLGFKWTLTVGAACWLLMYIVYVGTKPRWLIVISQSLHGLAYVFFIIVGQIFANTIAPEEIRGSMQALIFTATVGVGLFLGTQFAGVVMDLFRKEDKFQWRPIFMVPCGIMLACVLALVFIFKGQA
jgi:MFS family permease